ncbi:WhiB family transcriptional regulator [Planobispora rosea]|uniref:WhiB family transcriptional regulator n=1 Tax=Planobispora rosea TaxID=35762 RepID=UPI00083AFA52|nr:WhiB family transcriptional regulator [Planobispora rosea]
MTRPLRTVPLLPTAGGGTVRPERYHLARPGAADIAELRNALIDAAPACDATDAELFTGPDEVEPDEVREAREAVAKEICAICPARTECLAYALAIRPAVGVWAGHTADEIRTMVTPSAREVA